MAAAGHTAPARPADGPVDAGHRFSDVELAR
jgi:hypothetical protein